MQSGFPGTLYAGTRRGITDLTLTGAGNARPNVSGTNVHFSPVPIGSRGAASIRAPCDRGVAVTPASTCINSSGFPFTQPLLGNFGNLGRNTLRLNRLSQFDCAFVKDTPMREFQTLQFRVEFFNTLNTPTFGRLINDLTSPTFGLYTGTDTTTQRVQFGLKYIF